MKKPVGQPPKKDEDDKAGDSASPQPSSSTAAIRNLPSVNEPSAPATTHQINASLEPPAPAGSRSATSSKVTLNRPSPTAGSVPPPQTRLPPPASRAGSAKVPANAVTPIASEPSAARLISSSHQTSKRQQMPPGGTTTTTTAVPEPLPLPAVRAGSSSSAKVSAATAAAKSSANVAMSLTSEPSGRSNWQASKQQINQPSSGVAAKNATPTLPTPPVAAATSTGGTATPVAGSAPALEEKFQRGGTSTASGISSSTATASSGNNFKQQWTSGRSTLSVEPVTAVVQPPPHMEEMEDTQSQITPGAYALEGPAPIYAMGDEPVSGMDGDMLQAIEESNALVAQHATPMAAVAVAADSDDDEETAEFIFEAEVVQTIEAVIEEEEKDEFVRSRGCLYLGICAVAVIAIAIAVPLAVVQPGGGGTVVVVPDRATQTPTSAPTLSTLQPTRSPVRDMDRCFPTTRSIATELSRQDLTEPNLYILCPNTTFVVGNLFRPRPNVGEFPPLFAASNTRYQCGDDGAVENACVLRIGDVLFYGAEQFPEGQIGAYNVTLEGLTFERPAAGGGLMELLDGGTITFKNCIFQSTFGFTPFLLDYQADRGDAIVDGEPVRLWVVFENCLFENLRYNDNLIQVTHPSNSVEFRNCTFLDTANLAQGPGYAISATGAEVTLENNCFLDNDFGSEGGPILLTGGAPPLVAMNNHVSGSVVGTSVNDTCSFTAVQTEGQAQICIEADAAECLSSNNG